MISRQILPPCKGCEDRCIGCHSTCGDYKEYKAALEARREQVVAEHAECDFDRSVKEAVLRRKRRYKI